LRILHTSDWHLGRSFKKESLSDEQGRFVDQVVGVVKSEGVDLVVVAGDVFDRALPPAEAVEEWYRALERIVDTGAQVVGIAGNHDQGERIEIPPRLLREGVVIRGSREPGVVTLEFDDGPLLVAPIPFLDPFLARGLSDGEGAATHQSVLEGSLARVRKDVERSPRSLVVSHAFVRGGLESESERSLLQIGGAELVDASVFEGYSYVALGHLHRPQIVGGDERVAYCGSPIPYSFSETDPKTIRLADLSADGTNLSVELIPVEAGWPVKTLEDSFEELVSNPRYREYENRFYVRAILTDRVVQPGAMDRLRTRYAGIVELGYVFLNEVGDARSVDRDIDGGANPRKLADEFWDDVTGRSPTKPEALLLAEAIGVGFRDQEVST
jgi:exonuclease SbcD